jgi:hypothetical protein
MFGLDMMGNYETRKVGRFDQGEIVVSTARVTDGNQPYETAVVHPEYHGDKFIIVEAYDTIEQARVGHAKWVKTMTTEPLPDQLVDCCNAEIAQFGAALGMESTFKRVKK